MFKAIELEAGSRRRTGRSHMLDVLTRQEAIDALLRLLAKSADEVMVDPTRTMLRDGDALWTLVSVQAPEPPAERSSQRRGGAKHKQVR